MIKKAGFTMAEILLSLTIIGVVAAITLPSLMANINERTWNTQRKALYARMSQAIAMMPQVGGYGTLTEDENGSVTADTAAETFLTEGLSKVLKINNICDSDHLADCGIISSYTDMAGTVKIWPKTIAEFNRHFVDFSVSLDWGSFAYSQVNTKAAAFETPNGESMALYYNPHCIADIEVNGTTRVYSQPFMCANFIFDLNGNKGPNTVGKDIGFVTALYNFAPSIVMPIPLTVAAANNVTMVQKNASAACTTQDPNSRIPNKDELIAIYYNKDIVGVLPENGFWSGTIASAGGAWSLYFQAGHLRTDSLNHTLRAWCIER